MQYILNELVMGGMVLETNMTEIMTRIEEQNKIEKEEVGHNTLYKIKGFQFFMIFKSLLEIIKNVNNFYFYSN